MSRILANETAALSQSDRGALNAEIQRVLAVLSEVEAFYENDRECLKGWSGPYAIRVRLVEHLEARHAEERGPLVQRLADLHQQITLASMFESLPGLQH
ncbi:hypothetical protein [Microvirga calopogonii]|uniref:hypothetical protein n=1 Tax=Microvirga calopogonii TaxID=2078013 RepID=UPI000E0D60BD|nr:hypothetical protein [Microvirga calopogonii]